MNAKHLNVFDMYVEEMNQQEMLSSSGGVNPWAVLSFVAAAGIMITFLGPIMTGSARSVYNLIREIKNDNTTQPTHQGVGLVAVASD